MSKEREESGHGGNIGVYLDSKRRKFQDQMAGRVESETGSSPQIFQGLWFWVNGLTNPPLIELSPVIFRHGGKIIMHYNPSRVNFIIADRLPDSELKRIPYKCPIIKAQWIVDCIKNGNRISTENYLIQRLNCSPDNSITRFLTEIRHVEKSESNSSVQSDSAAQISNHGSRTKEVRSTLTDPDFVKNFFSSSRLHFIGSWKQNFEFLIHQYRNGTPLYGKPVKNCAFMNRVIVHIDMDCFFASVAMREDETLRNLPIAVSHSVSAGSGEISTANYIARGYGIRSGMVS